MSAGWCVCEAECQQVGVFVKQDVSRLMCDVLVKQDVSRLVCL